MGCWTCSNTVQVAAPLIFIGTIALVVGGVVAYNYRTINTILEEQKEAMCVYMNQWTMVVSTNVQVEYECKSVCEVECRHRPPPTPPTIGTILYRW